MVEAGIDVVTRQGSCRHYSTHITAELIGNGQMLENHDEFRSDEREDSKMGSQAKSRQQVLRDEKVTTLNLKRTLLTRVLRIELFRFVGWH